MAKFPTEVEESVVVPAAPAAHRARPVGRTGAADGVFARQDGLPGLLGPEGHHQQGATQYPKIGIGLS